MDKEGKEKKKDNNIKQILKIQSDKNIYNKKGSKLNKIKQKIEKYSFPIKIFVIIIFIFLFIVPIIKDFDNEYKKIVLKTITNEEIYTTRKKAFKNGRIFMSKCFKGININNKSFNESQKPKISVIIPVYNSGEIIKSVIKSVQNQNFANLEIILVNDFSKDNTSQIIQSIKNEDLRITIINNNKNMGILYSRCIAVLQAKGKYIMNLDHDDFFFDEDVIDTAYKAAQNGNYDIISFMDIECKKYFLPLNKMKDGNINKHHHNLTLVQPELSHYPLFKNEEFGFCDSSIWGKLYKSDIYKQAVNLLGEKRYSTFNINNEDLIGIFVIFKVAKTFKYIRKYGIFHRDYHGSIATTSSSLEHRKYAGIFFIEIIYDLSYNKDKKYAAIFAKADSKILLSKNISQKNLTYLREILNKILNCQYIEEKYKKEIREKYIDIL